MCGWYQNQRDSTSYRWRIDTERSVSKSEKSNLNRNIIQMTGRLANGMTLTDLLSLTEAVHKIGFFECFLLGLN